MSHTVHISSSGSSAAHLQSEDFARGGSDEAPARRVIHLHLGLVHPQPTLHTLMLNATVVCPAMRMYLP